MGDMLQSNNDTKEFFMKSLNAANGGHTEHFQDIEARVKAQNLQIDVNIKEIGKLESECQSLNVRTKHNRTKIDQHKEKIIELEMGKFDKTALGSFKDDIYKSMVAMERSLVKADNEMQTIMNFVDKYVPLNLQ